MQSLVLCVLSLSLSVFGQVAVNTLPLPSVQGQLELQEDHSHSSWWKRSNWLGKRQPPPPPAVMTRTIYANFHFTCPGGRVMTREFEWGAAYFTAHHTLHVVPIHNIDSVTDMQIDHSDFEAHWNAKWCEHRDLELCEYTIRAMTQGKIEARGIAMDLVTGSLHMYEDPVITERCLHVQRLAPNDTCGKTKGAVVTGHSGPCSIESVDIHASE